MICTKLKIWRIPSHYSVFTKYSIASSVASTSMAFWLWDIEKWSVHIPTDVDLILCNELMSLNISEVTQE